MQLPMRRRVADDDVVQQQELAREDALDDTSIHAIS
jgi:hypothetical protein